MGGILNGECRFFLQISVQKVAQMCKRLYYCSMNNEQNQKMMDLTQQSEKVAQAIYDLHDMEGIGCNIHELAQETGLSEKVLRGNISDLVKKGVISVDPKELSGARFDLYEHKELQEW